MVTGNVEPSPTQDQGLPLYQQIKRWIKEAIARGDYDPDIPFTTERELRERFGVSTATAVRALNDLVGEGVLIRRRARGTFVAEPVARPRSAEPEGRNIAYVAWGHAGPHGAGIMRGIGAVCVELGYRFFVTDTAPSRDLETRAIRDAIDSGASGVLWFPQDGPADSSLLAELDRHQIPTVFIDRYPLGSVADAVLADNFAVGYRVTHELIRQGHHRIATLWGEWQCTSVNDRLSGHIQALREHDSPVSAELTALRPYVDHSDEKRQDFLRSLLSSPEPPTAMMCANGFVLAMVAHDLVTIGVRVPEDIELAGMDDAGPFDLLPLASVAAHLPSEQMGAEAMRILARRMSGEQERAAEHVVLPISLLSGRSTRIHLRPVSTEDPERTT